MIKNIKAVRINKMKTSLVIQALFISNVVYAETESQQVNLCYVQADLIKTIAIKRDSGVYPNQVEKELDKHNIGEYKPLVSLVYRYPTLSASDLRATALQGCLDNMKTKGDI
jgi:hypothetical protein